MAAASAAEVSAPVLHRNGAAAEFRRGAGPTAVKTTKLPNSLPLVELSGSCTSFKESQDAIELLSDRFGAFALSNYPKTEVSALYGQEIE